MLTATEVERCARMTGILATPAHGRERGVVLLTSLWPDVSARATELLAMHGAREIELVSVPRGTATDSLAERGHPHRLLTASLIEGPDGALFDGVTVQLSALLYYDVRRIHLDLLADWAYARRDSALLSSVLVAVSARGEYPAAKRRDALTVCAAGWNRYAGLLPSPAKPTPRQWVELRRMFEEGVYRPRQPIQFLVTIVDRGWVEPVIGSGGGYRLTEAGRDALKRANQMYLRRPPKPRSPGSWTDAIR